MSVTSATFTSPILQHPARSTSISPSQRCTQDEPRSHRGGTGAHKETPWREFTAVRTPWSRERAFTYLSDLRHFADWDPGVKSAVQVTGEGPGLGAAYDLTVAAAGRDMTLRYETVAFDVPQRIEVRAQTSTLRSVDVVTFTDTAGGRLHRHLRRRPVTPSLLAVGNPFLGLAFRRIGDRAANGLRHALEGTDTAERPGSH